MSSRSEGPAIAHPAGTRVLLRYKVNPPYKDEYLGGWMDHDDVWDETEDLPVPTPDYIMYHISWWYKYKTDITREYQRCIWNAPNDREKALYHARLQHFSLTNDASLCPTFRVSWMPIKLPQPKGSDPPDTDTKPLADKSNIDDADI